MPAAHAVDSRYAWGRLGVALALMTVGSSAMYVVAVVLPSVQAEFGVARADASLPYTLLMVGFGIGGVFMGRLADRRGIVLPLFIGAAGLGIGFVAAGLSQSIWSFAIVHGLLLGLVGSSASFAPLVADTSLWFQRRRGIAVAICASGNYVAGAIWPPIVQHFVEAVGWRQTYIGLGIFSAVVMATLAIFMRGRPPALVAAAVEVRSGAPRPSTRPFGLSTTAAQTLLCIAGVACCVAMAMPQVHIVAYCGDLGYGAARGAQMLSLMLAAGVISRLASGFICDRIGGLRTLLLGSLLQGTALMLFLPFDSLASLYVVSALFGLFQGGIVPSYAIIVREHFPAAEAGGRVGTVLMFTLFGMALGGWMSGKVFDLTGSYHAAFLNGIAWNLVNLSIALFLLRGDRAKRLARWRSLRLKNRLAPLPMATTSDSSAKFDLTGDAAQPDAYSTGILPSQELKALVLRKEIFALEPIADDQFQPASLDLRLGPIAYRVRASFLPGKGTVKAKLDEFAMHEMDITAGGVLEKGCVYIIPLLEGLDLRHRTSAMGNPKSSTGRLDIFTRLITDQGTAFDQVKEQYSGMLYAEVSPRTFSVLVRKGSRLSQLRLRRGRPIASDGFMKRLQQEHGLVQLPDDHPADGGAVEIVNGVPVRVDLAGRQSGGVIGYKAKSHAGLVDIDRIGHYEVADYWEPVHAPARGGLILDPAEFYILASQEAVRVPPGFAAEMIAYDTLVGEFRVHYAGFFDPGFGHDAAGGEGSRAVLEVRSYEVPFVLEHGQLVGRLAYERLTATPAILYGQGVKSSYQGQGIKLSKHFKAVA